MKKQIKLLILMLFTIVSITVLGNNTSYASSDFTLKEIDFDIALNEDGSMDVVENWNIKVHSKTNTLFKTFEIDKSKYKEITNVQVSEIIDGEEKTFTEKNEEVLHVDKNCYYDLVNSDGKYEIAWGINENSGNKTYKVKYKVVDAIKNYGDCSELYWQFIGEDFEIDINKVTGTIILPEGLDAKEDIRAWAHGPLNGNITIESNNRVSFEIEYLDAGNYLEVRLAMPTMLFLSNENTDNADRMDTILTEENHWANEANLLREQKIKEREAREKRIEMFKKVLTVVIALLALFFVTKTNKYSKKLAETPKLVPTQELDYYRDIPDENVTPATAAFLYYLKNGSLKQNMPKIISSTMLDLSIKKYIEFENKEIKPGKQEIIVHLKQGDKPLSKDEETIYELLTKISPNQYFTMKELEKYAKKNYETFLNSVDKVEKIAKQENINRQNYSKEIHKEGTEYNVISALYIFAVFAVVILGIVLKVPIIIIALFTLVGIICAVQTIKIGSRLNGLTQKGIDEQEEWIALKKYMEDFSMIDDKEVIELILWEKYLVYATAFGIADKVLKQLKVVYPQILEDDYNDGTYLRLMYYGGIHNSFIHSLENGVNSAYTGSVSAKASYDYGNSSSGGGFGGGFSGGGGFGGGGGGRRRSLNAKSRHKSENNRGKWRKTKKNKKLN